MALHRKFDALWSLKPDVAIVSECAAPERVRPRLPDDNPIHDMLWVGRNPNKGLAVLTFNGYSATLAAGHDPALELIAPVSIEGDLAFSLLAVWAQNLSGGNYRKDQPGPLRIALDRYRTFFESGSTVAAGDFNKNVIWDRPGWPMNHADAVEILDGHGLVSTYHAITGETQGQEQTPTIYWRDRTKDGPTYHLDYVFLPAVWLPDIHQFEVGSYEDWCGSGLSDHVPLVVDIRRG